MTSRFIFDHLPEDFYLDILGPDTADAVNSFVTQLALEFMAEYSVWMWPGLGDVELESMVELVEAYFRAVFQTGADRADDAGKPDVLSARVQQALQTMREPATAGWRSGRVRHESMPALVSSDDNDNDGPDGDPTEALATAFANLAIFPTTPPPNAAQDFQAMATIYTFINIPSASRPAVLGPEIAESVIRHVPFLVRSFVSEHSEWLWPGKGLQDLEDVVLPLIERYLRVLVRVEARREEVEGNGIWLPEVQVRDAVMIARRQADEVMEEVVVEAKVDEAKDKEGW
ncbi:hypothetical protein B0A48_16794 [Cryoendolithus antarcticus]|uniref:Uncharacterized protein n=1 Tax=Cryoendolithus antarcticus TaxID=1507870 RepID=A0A1V8SDM4_9PEZI|nr:hypothetical protein B0A48_16794 [Cryoendolithus antarcticus]